MENSTIHDQFNTPFSPLPSELIALERRKEFLEAQIKELKEICDVLDPFGPLDDEIKTKLCRLGIEDFSDPFKLTNQVVTQVEDALEELGALTGDLPKAQ